MLLLALAFLFESWVWDRLVAAVRWVSDRIPWEAFRERARARFNLWPATVSVIVFGLPFVIVEVGSTFSLILIALGRVLVGLALYLFLKLALLTVVAVVFDLTKEKLMTLPWFVFLYEKLLALRQYAFRIVAPYRERALRAMDRLRSQSRAFWLRLVEGRAESDQAVVYVEADPPFRRGRSSHEA
jgi:hypothetical protein